VQQKIYRPKYSWDKGAKVRSEENRFNVKAHQCYCEITALQTPSEARPSRKMELLVPFKFPGRPLGSSAKAISDRWLPPSGTEFGLCIGFRLFPLQIFF